MKTKNYQTLYAIKKFYFIFCIYKMYLISAKGYENTGVRLLIENETGIIWVSIKNIQDGLDVQNISDLLFKKNILYLYNKKPYERSN